jgi:hypothetical protein
LGHFGNDSQLLGCFENPPFSRIWEKGLTAGGPTARPPRPEVFRKARLPDCIKNGGGKELL